MRQVTRGWISAWMGVVAMGIPGALSAQSWWPGTPLLDLRLRYETVDDDAFARTAHAWTLRSRLGWRSAEVAGWYGLVEVEHVGALDDRYASGRNGRTGVPAIADPEASEWNQLHVGWRYAEGSQWTLGRQRLLFDNQRHIGAVGWRQNEQTFDALAWQHTAAQGWVLRAAWLNHVHRVFGHQHPDPRAAGRDLRTGLLNVARTAPAGTWVGYAYLHEDEDQPAASTRSLGLRGTRRWVVDEHLSLLAGAEWSLQSAYAQAVDRGSVQYRWAELGTALGDHTLRLGLEHLTGNGRVAYQTPLATGHAFNGWADRYLQTPLDGLRDHHLKLEGPLGRLRYSLAWHDFSTERHGSALGHEFNAQLSWTVRPGLTALIKWADHRGARDLPDVRKFWWSLDYRW